MYKKIVSLIFLLFIMVTGVFSLKSLFPELETAAKEYGFDKNFTNTVDSYLEENFPKRFEWINLNGAVLKYLGITFVEEKSGTDVYKLKNGDIIYSLKKKDSTENIKNIGALMEYTQKNSEADLLYVQLPFKIKNEDLPMGAQCYGRENAENVVSALLDANVPVCDLYTTFLMTESNYSNLFYHTDHHWKPGTALRAADLICSEAQQRWGLPYNHNLLQPESYDVTVFKDWFLGSLGKRVGIYYAGVDDFELYTPKENTHFTLTAESANGPFERNGAFEKSLICKARYTPKDYFKKNNYAAYIGGDYAINHVINHMADNDTKVLLLRDSFSCAMQPFLCMNYAEVTAVDLRHYTEKTIYELIDESDFDLIIIAYNPSALAHDELFHFTNK